MMVKDEADIIAANLRWHREEVDYAIVSDNGSTDGTRQILEEVQAETDAAWLEILDDPEVGYYQSRKMTRMAEKAAELGHKWVVPADADEFWSARPLTRPRDGVTAGADTVSTSISETLAAVREQYSIVPADLFDYVATGLDYKKDHICKKLGWRRIEPLGLPKVAARLRPGLVIEQGNHGAHYPGPSPRTETLLNVRHYPYRSVEHFVRKTINGGKAYEASDLPFSVGQHWREYYGLWQAHGEAAIDEIFHTWFYSPAPITDPSLVFDPIKLRG